MTIASKHTDANRDFRLVLVAAAAWCGAWVGTGTGWSGIGLAMAVGITGWVAGAQGRRTAIQAGALALTVVVALSAARWHQTQSSPLAGLAADRAIVELGAVVRGDPRVSLHNRFGNRTVMVVGEVRTVHGRGSGFAQRHQVLITGSGDNGRALQELRVGARIRATVRLAPTDTGPLVAYAALRSTPVMIDPPGRFDDAIEAVRAGLRDSVAELPSAQRGLVPALVVGDTSQQSTELVEQFRVTGLTHLTAVSGANLTLLLAFLLTAAKWVGVRGRGLLVVGLGGVVVFVALCRTEPSVLRASAMGLVALAALGGHAQPGKGARHLCVAVLALVLVDPWLGRSVGFALSVLASAGIIGWSALWRDRMAWLPKPLAEAVTVPLAAQLATQPVVTAISGQVSMVGLVANALAGPFVGPATVLGFATAGLSVIAPPAAGFTGWLAGWCAQGIIWVAQVGASLPGAAWAWPVTVAGIVIVASGCVVGFLAGGHVLASRGLSLLMVVVLVAVVARPQTVPGWPPGDWLVAGCDVGQGSATVLRAGEGQAVVIDTGPQPAALERCLSQLDITAVPLLVLTHYHADHIDGRSAVMGRRPVSLLLVSPLASPSAVAERVRSEAMAVDLPVVEARPGQHITVGAVRWRTLGPVSVPRTVATDRDGESSAENDASIIAMAEVGSVRVLLTGDVEPAGQRALLRAGADLRAEVLTVPHHGSGRQDEGFVRATGPGVALVSAGKDNDYGHPAPSTLRLLQASGRQNLRTDQQGSVAVGGARGAPTLVVQRQHAHG